MRHFYDLSQNLQHFYALFEELGVKKQKLENTGNMNKQ